jgi:hypothetical protein
LRLSAYGQSMLNLKELGINETVPIEQAVIDRNFIQRLGFSSGGFPQDIKIINIERAMSFILLELNRPSNLQKRILFTTF